MARHHYQNDSDVCNLTASLIYGVGKAHAFEQGNKRTAFMAGLLFIESNGFGYFGRTETPNGMSLGLMIIDMVKDAATESDISSFLREKFIHRITYPISN